MSKHKKVFAGRFLSLFLVLVLVGSLFTAFQLTRPLPQANAQKLTPLLSTSSISSLAWPNYGQAAVGAVNYGILETNGEQKPVPIASVAKIITALSIIKKKPLTMGEQGPVITITQADEAIFNEYFAKDGSLVKVQAGQKLSLYQAMQAILLPSANNVADTTAIWAFGSLANYVTFANNYVKTLGMKNTTIADASGFSPNTISTASDLILLGQAALFNPVIAEIINQKQAVIPVAGTIYNVNGLLGRDGINGIKTGNTDEAGGCFLTSAKRVVNGKEINVITAVLGADNLEKSMLDSVPLLNSAAGQFQLKTVAKKGQIVGGYTTAWGEITSAMLQKDITAVVWPSQQLSLTANMNSLSSPAQLDTNVGSAEVVIAKQVFKSPVITGQAIHKPSLNWRLTNSFK